MLHLFNVVGKLTVRWLQKIHWSLHQILLFVLNYEILVEFRTDDILTYDEKHNSSIFINLWNM